MQSFLSNGIWNFELPTIYAIYLHFCPKNIPKERKCKRLERWFGYTNSSAFFSFVFSANVDNKIGLNNPWIIYHFEFDWKVPLTRQKGDDRRLFVARTPTPTCSTVVIWTTKSVNNKKSTHATLFCVFIKFKRITSQRNFCFVAQIFTRSLVCAYQMLWNKVSFSSRFSMALLWNAAFRTKLIMNCPQST